MNRFITFSRSLLGLDDVLPEEKDDPRRKLRWRVGVGATIVVGLAVVAGAVVVSTMTSLGSTTSIPLELSSSRKPAPSAAGTSGAPNASANRQTGETLVHVVGAVRSPGMYQLEVGARVLDAVMAAGGFTETAQQCAVNMARAVSDGEQLTIPAGEANECGTTSPTHNKVSLNRATASELDTLPGIGPTLAQRIIDWRNAHGSFTALNQLTQVSGVSEKLFASVKDQITL
jgi:competence protein ComEA